MGGVPSHVEASPELILSSSVLNECEFGELNSGEDMCLSLVSVGSSLVVASWESVWCVEVNRKQIVICNFQPAAK